MEDSPAPKNPISHEISPSPKVLPPMLHSIHSAGGHVAAGLNQFRAGQCHYGAWEPGPAAVPLIGGEIPIVHSFSWYKPFPNSWCVYIYIPSGYLT